MNNLSHRYLIIIGSIVGFGVSLAIGFLIGKKHQHVDVKRSELNQNIFPRQTAPARELTAFESVKRVFNSYGSYLYNLHVPCKPTVEDVDIYSKESHDSESTLRRRATLVTYPNARATVVISHGFMCERQDTGIIRQLFPKGQYNFISFDMRAHGELKEGQLCTFGKHEALDVLAAVAFVKSHENLKKLPILGYGFSMGAVATIEAQSLDPHAFQALVLDCPFDSTENLMKRLLKSLKFSFFGYEFDMPGSGYLEQYAFHPYVQSFIRFLLKTIPHMDSKNIQTYMHKFSPAESIRNVSVPCFFIHCKNDIRVNTEAVKTLFQNVQGPKIMWLTNGRGHYDSIFYNPETYSKRVSSFYDKVLNGQIYKLEKEVFKEDEDKP